MRNQENEIQQFSTYGYMQRKFNEQLAKDQAGSTASGLPPPTIRLISNWKC